MARISVLLATFNGELFLQTQIRSALAAIGSYDAEIIASDDGSTDSTLDILRAELPSSAEIYCNHFRSPAFNFEFLIGKASGDILFLCDQDDVWMPYKIERVLDVFQQRPRVTLVLSDAQIIDDKGQTISDSFFKPRGGFHSGIPATVFSNRYIGCSMAFRRSMVRYLLPFPRDVPMHDMWIGAVNSIYGKTHYIAEPLLGYRRHQRNASPFEHASFMQMVRWRYALVKDLLRLAARFPPITRQHA